MEDPNLVNQQLEIEQIHKKHLQESLGKNCAEIVRNINMNSAYFNIFLLLVLLIEAANVSYIIVLVFLWIFDIQEILNQVRFHQSIQFMDNSFDEYKAKVKRMIKIEIFDCIVGFAFKVSILLFFEKQTNSLAMPSLVAFGYFCVRIISNLICRAKKRELSEQEAEFTDSLQLLQAERQTNSFYFIINNWVFRIYCVSQAIFYSLKMEDYIDWNWSEVFWIYWVFFCIIIGITLIIFLLLVVKVCDFCGGAKSELVEIQGLFWFFMIMCFISANSSYSVLMYIDVLQAIDTLNIVDGKNLEEIHSNQETLSNAQESLLPIIYQVTGGFCGQLLYFLAFKKQISAFVKLIMYEYGEDEEDEEQQNQQQRNQQNNNQNRDQRGGPPRKVRMAYKSKMVLEEKEVAQAMNLPQFVSKVSSTYFKFLMNKKDVQQEIQKKKKIPKQKKEKLQIQIQSPSNDGASKNMKGRAFSIRSLNRSATATITMNTQGNTNTQADMLHSSRVNTQEKQFNDQNDFEDVFKEGNSGSQDKKDLRGENQLKKNMKALIKQRFDIPNFMSPKEMNSQKLHIPTNAVNNDQSDQDHDDINEHQYIENTNAFSPVGGIDQPFNQNRRQISMANPNNPMSAIQNGRGQKDLNQTAPFVATNKKQERINEEEEHDSYYYDAQAKQSNKINSNQNNKDDIIHFDDESQNTTKREIEQSQNMTQSLQQSVSTCLVCFDATPDSIFNPCGHGGLCYECAIDLMKKTGECYLCRQKIEEILKIDIESRNQGIMKIITTTKLVKVREKIEITEQEYQYYSAIRRNRRLQQQQQSQQIPQNNISNNNNNQQIRSDQGQQLSENQQNQQLQQQLIQEPQHQLMQDLQQNSSVPNMDHNQNYLLSQQNVDENNHIVADHIQLQSN